MANIILTKSDFSGIVAISDEVSELVDSNYYLPSVYEGNPFSFTLKLDYYTDDEIPTQGNILSSNCLTDLSNVGVTVNKISANTYIFSGSYSNVIKGAIYTFVMKNGEIKNLPIDTTEDFKAIIKFRLPPTKLEVLNVNFQLSLEGLMSNIETTANTLQYVHYSYSSAIIAFKDVISKGK
jgi:hypothetical protein